MAADDMYHDGMRRLQDIRETRPLADRLNEVTVRTAFTEEDRAFIQRCPMFFIATADAQGRPDCSYKGGLPGFVRILDDHTLVVPDYDGNGMYRTWGNVIVNPHVGLLFLDFEQPKRIRVNGTAQVRMPRGKPIHPDPEPHRIKSGHLDLTEEEAQMAAPVGPKRVQRYTPFAQACAPLRLGRRVPPHRQRRSH
jgi:predicted pyridoxine 5'-phosphate oxidase superfamily flavin-nucleotide-binding protein